MNPRERLEAYGLHPKQALGQNFMHDQNALEKIVASAHLAHDETALEIGPGTGELTAALARVARRVVAVEADERLVPLLEERFAQAHNVYFVFEDILKTQVAALVGTEPYAVVANVPYYITSAILRHLYDAPTHPRRAVITMQLEVAQRIVARPGDLSLLGVSVQYYGKPTLVSKLNRGVFWPRPDVDSAILRLDTHLTPIVDVPSDEAFFRVVRAGFSQKRKQVKNALAAGLAIPQADAEACLQEAHIDPQRRAETLALDEWAALARLVDERFPR